MLTKAGSETNPSHMKLKTNKQTNKRGLWSLFMIAKVIQHMI